MPKQLDDLATRLLWELHDFRQEMGRFPKIRELCQRVNHTRDVVRPRLMALEEAGKIRIIKDNTWHIELQVDMTHEPKTWLQDSRVKAWLRVNSYEAYRQLPYLVQALSITYQEHDIDMYYYKLWHLYCNQWSCHATWNYWYGLDCQRPLNEDYILEYERAE